MADQENLSWILEFLLRQPIPNSILHCIFLALPLSSSSSTSTSSSSSSPFSRRLIKTLLLRRLASHLPSIPPQTLDTLEVIEQFDRDDLLVEYPSISLQIAYSAVAVDLTVRFLKQDQDLGDFFDAVNRVWNCRVGDLGSSEARGLVSMRLREERRLMEEAVVNQDARVELMGRDTKKEAAEAVIAYLKEAVEEMGPTFIEKAATAAVIRGRERGEAFPLVGRDGVGVPVGGNDASGEGGYSTNIFNHLLEPKIIQEKHQQKPVDRKDHDMIEPLSDTLTAAAGVSTVGTGFDSNLERMVEHKSPKDRGHAPTVDKGAEVSHTRDISSGTAHNSVNDTVLQPRITVQNPSGLEQREENENAFGGNAKVSSLEKGKGDINTECRSTLIGKRDSNAVQTPTESNHGEKNENKEAGNAKVSSIDKGKIAVNTEGTSTLNGRMRDSHTVGVPSIMDRNPTACTYEWHDDFIESPEGSPNPSHKLHIPKISYPKRGHIPEKKRPWNREFAGRRKRKWWSTDEEDILRKAVDKYGVGNWALIKNSYPAIFEDRTPVDLKDKWRNMTR